MAAAVGGVLAALAAPAAAQDVAAERWRAIGRQIERDLADGRAIRAARSARRMVGELVDQLAAGPDDGATLGGMLLLQAVAESALGNRADALWSWSLAQGVDPSLLTADLSRFGAVADLLADNRLREPAQDGQLAAEELADRPGVFERASAAEPPRVVRLPDPEYPRAARAAGLAGAVILQVLLDRQGQPRSPVIVESPAPPLAWAAAEAVRQGRYEPARLDGRPIAVYYDIRIDFQL